MSKGLIKFVLVHLDGVLLLSNNFSSVSFHKSNRIGNEIYINPTNISAFVKNKFSRNLFTAKIEKRKCKLRQIKIVNKTNGAPDNS